VNRRITQTNTPLGCQPIYTYELPFYLYSNQCKISAVCGKKCGRHLDVLCRLVWVDVNRDVLYASTNIDFTFMLPCIVIDSFLNNQPDAPVIQIYSVIKLYMFRASSLPIIMEFFTVHSALMHETYQCRMYSRKLLDDGQRRCPKHVEFYNRINLESWCVWLVI